MMADAGTDSSKKLVQSLFAMPVFSAGVAGRDVTRVTRGCERERSLLARVASETTAGNINLAEVFEAGERDTPVE